MINFDLHLKLIPMSQRISAYNHVTNLHPIPIAVVGLSFGKYILKCLKEKPARDLFRVIAVCDVRRDVADEVGNELGVKVFYSLEELLRDSEVKVVGLFTGPSGRAELIRQIIRSGKDVLTTKPFELDYADTKAILNEARNLGRVIHLNSPSPEPTEELTQIHRWREENDLGRIVAVRADVWVSYFEQSDGSWMDDPLNCPGGPMMRLGIYLINDLVSLAGAPDEILLRTSRMRTGRPTADNAILTMTFASGCLGSIYASFCVEDGDHYSNGMSLQFERGSIYRNIGVARNQTGFDKSLVSLVRRGPAGHRIVEDRAFGECSGIYQWQALHDAVLGRKSISLEYMGNILAGVKVIEAMRLSPENLCIPARPEAALA